MRNPRFYAGVAAVLVAVAAGVLTPTPASAWQRPTVTATGGTCTGGTGTDALPRGLIFWTLTNHETEFPRSPAEVVAVKVTNNYPTSWSTQLLLPNTGVAQAKAQTYVPPGHSGPVKLHVEITFDGPDGHHGPLVAEATVNVVACPQDVPPPPPVPTTTTTTVPSTSTSTTAPSTTSTTVVAVQAAALPAAPPAQPVVAQPNVTG